MSQITHKNQIEVIDRVTADMTGFDITLYNSFMLDNNGSDDAQVYFNGDTSQYWLIKAGSVRGFADEFLGERSVNTIKIVFAGVTATKSMNVVQVNKEIYS